jgi:RNA polymerase sigma-70 factor (sigma-E family)
MAERSADGPEAGVDADTGVAALFRTHRLGMVRLALLLVDDRESAEDVVQDAFAALHRRWPQLDSDHAAAAYLRISVVNGARSALRKRQTVRSYLRAADAPDMAPPADTGVVLADEQRELMAALAALPERQREVIVLRYWSELSEAEIASTLGISVGGVKSSASRGRDALAAILEARS